MNTEYERGRFGVRAHLFSRIESPATVPVADSCPGMRCLTVCHFEDSDESFKFLDQPSAFFRTQVGAVDEALCSLEHQRRSLRTAEADRLSEMQARFLEHFERILEGFLFQGSGVE